MTRTTLDIDETVLRELRRRREREGKTLGALVSELLASRLADEGRSGAVQAEQFAWRSRPMRARVELEDKDALNAALDRE
ncbi:MAG: hypothetical protein ACRDL0_14675 [Thermoleophilaceae bacterium]